MKKLGTNQTQQMSAQITSNLSTNSSKWDPKSSKNQWKIIQELDVGTYLPKMCKTASKSDPKRRQKAIVAENASKNMSEIHEKTSENRHACTMRQNLKKHYKTAVKT